jgi:hypothetical protein
MFGNITVSITEDSSHLPSMDFVVLILKQIVVTLQPSFSTQSGRDLILVEGLHTGYIFQVGGQSVNTSFFLDNSVGCVSPALRPGLHSIHVLNFQQISVAESSLLVLESSNFSDLRVHPQALEV